jgi:hypothetical protein
LGDAGRTGSAALTGIIVVRQAGSAAGLIPVADALTAATDAGTVWRIVVIAYPQAIKTSLEVASHPDRYTIHAVDSELQAQHYFNQHIGQAALVLTGTSAEAEADAQFWRIARQHGVASIAYLDQWSNIEQRFPGALPSDWPDHLAVIDVYDQQLAHAIAPPGVTIHNTGSPALDNIRHQVAQLRAQGVKADPHRIVFATEPVAQPAQFRALHGGADEDSFDLALTLIRTHHPGATLALRLHPRDTQARWRDKIPADINFEWDDKTRAETLASSAIVFGMRSFFLVEAAAAGVAVFSLQPGKKTYCPLTDERMKVVVAATDYPV